MSSIGTERPSKYRQRYAADKVIAAINKKIEKTSYNNIASGFGKGHLVVGLPLWFATPPIKVNRVKNALDDFATRVILGLMEIRRKVLKKGNCPFYKITVVWDLSVSAMEEWLKNSNLDEHRYFSMPSFIEKPSFTIKPQDFIEMLKLLENHIKEKDNTSAPLKLSINLEGKKQPNDWLKNLKIISQNSDAKLVLAIEKEKGKDKKKEQLQAKMEKYRKQIRNVLLYTAFNIVMYIRVFGLSNLFKKFLQKFSLKRIAIIKWLSHKQRKLYLNSMNRKKAFTS